MPKLRPFVHERHGKHVRYGPQSLCNGCRTVPVGVCLDDGKKF